MDEVEERLIEEVQKYQYLYCNAAPQYKDSQRARNTWRKISQDVGLDEIECTKRWRNLRDKYVRLRKRLSSQSGDRRSRKLPAFYHRMTWLGPHVTHREEESRRTSKPVSKNQTGASPSSPEPSHLPSPSVSPQPQPQPQPGPSSDTSPPPPHRPDPRCCCHARLQSRGRAPGDGAWCPDEALVKQMSQLQDRWLEAQCKLQEDRDECSRFGLTVADMLRKVPEEKRSDVMFHVYKTLYDERQK